jgi:hypothetical protein
MASADRFLQAVLSATTISDGNGKRALVRTHVHHISLHDRALRKCKTIIRDENRDGTFVRRVLIHTRDADHYVESVYVCKDRLWRTHLATWAPPVIGYIPVSMFVTIAIFSIMSVYASVAAWAANVTIATACSLWIYARGRRARVLKDLATAERERWIDKVRDSQAAETPERFATLVSRVEDGSAKPHVLVIVCPRGAEAVPSKKLAKSTAEPMFEKSDTRVRVEQRRADVVQPISPKTPTVMREPSPPDVGFRRDVSVATLRPCRECGKRDPKHRHGCSYGTSSSGRK